MKQKLGRKLLGVLLALALVVGLVPGMSLTAYAAGGTEVTQANVKCQQYSYHDAGSYSGGVIYDTPPADITNIALADAQAFGAAVNCPTTYWVVVYAKDGDNLKWTSNGKTGEQTSTPRSASGRVLSAWCELFNDDVFRIGGNCDANRDVTFYFSKGLATVSVTGVSLDKTTAQTINVDGKVSFTATVAPNNATDKKVKWSVGGTNAGAVKLYSDEACTTEVGTAATSTLTVYAKGISAGSATVTCTSNADSNKTASCGVTVNKLGVVPATVDANNRTSDGTPQPLVMAGSVEGGTLYYALGSNSTTAPADGWSTEVPTATEAGTYYVWYKVVGDANHNDVDPACVVVTIVAPAASTSDYTLLASFKTSGKKALKMGWTAVPGAEGYDVFFGMCNKGDCQLLASVNGTSYKIKGLKKGFAYKGYVRAWKNVGGAKTYIGEPSPDVHAITNGKSNHYTNPKKISVKKKKLTVGVGKTKAIKAKLKKFSDSRNYLNHVSAKVRYYSSDRTVATVSANGRVTGVGPGKCTVFAVAENGLRVGVKVTVK